MSFLDLIHLFFEPHVTIEDESSIFSKEWHMTLQHVLHQPGLNAAYTTGLTDGHNIWVFLLWENEDHRSHFYYQTSGFRFMVHHMSKPPSVLFFGDSSYAAFDKTSDWLISIVSAGTEEAQELKRSYEEKEFDRFLNFHDFVAPQEKEVTKKLYEGADGWVFAIAALARADRWKWEAESRWTHYFVNLNVCKWIGYASPSQVEAPLNTAELARKQPWEYCVLMFDDSQYSDTAYQMGMTYAPMSTIGLEGKFHQASCDRPVQERAIANEYCVCIISILVDPSRWSEGDKSLTEHLRRSLRLENGTPGLRELSILRSNDCGDKVQVVRFLCVWDSNSDLSQWRQQHTIDDETEHKVILSFTVSYSWISAVTGLQKLEWDNLPLTSDNQSYQTVNKILELVEFTFTQHLTAVEKAAFLYRLQNFINTMSSNWSHYMDARPIVYAEDPVWTEEIHSPSKCLLFLAWDGIGQRAAWLRNFFAHDFSWTGHIAHVLGLVCSGVESEDFRMEKLHTWPLGHKLPPKFEGQDKDEEGDDGDFEGF